MKLSMFLLCITLLCNTNVFAQNEADDCIIYKSVLDFFNEKRASVKSAIRKEKIDRKGDIKQIRVKLKGLQQYNFYIVDEKIFWRWEYSADWKPAAKRFSEIVKDSTVIFENYRYNEDSTHTCTFGNDIKYQYKPFSEISFSAEDYTREKRGRTTVHYSPVKIGLSQILYTEDNRALVVVGVSTTGGRYGGSSYFVFKKDNDNWVLSTVNGEAR